MCEIGYLYKITFSKYQIHSYAQLLMQLNRFEEAKRNFVDSLDVYIKIHGGEDPEVVALLNNLAVVCTNASYTLAFAYVYNIYPFLFIPVK